MNLHDMDPTKGVLASSITRALGWFSIGLGIAELLMPRTVAHSAGVDGRSGLVRSFGVRELATGVGLLTAKRPAPWLWARVMGDGIDMLAVGSGLGDRSRRPYAALALGAIAAVAALDVVAARSASNGKGREAGPPPDYGERSGFPQAPATMRGAARGGFGPPQ